MFVKAVRNRFSQFEITMKDVNGNNITISAGDVVRVKVGRDEGPPILDISSLATQNPATTHCTQANPTVVTVIAGDLNFAAGVYNIEAQVFEDGDTALKHVDKGTFGMIESQTGNLGATNPP